jgi:hypothetical protein
MKGYFTHRIPPIRFGHPYGHLKGDALQRIDTSKRYELFESLHRYKKIF